MFKKLLRSFGYALAGLRVAWNEELNFRIELICAAIVIALALVLHLSALESALVVFAISFVLVAESLNTALEELCDMFQPTQNAYIAKIKDLAAAAVLLASFGALVVGLLIFLPHIA